LARSIGGNRPRPRPDPRTSRSDPLAIGASYPPITITVNVAEDAPATVTNQVTASGGATVQVDSVQKPLEDDVSIPANVRQAVNFYQTVGLLHGRAQIHAAGSARTSILGICVSGIRYAGELRRIPLVRADFHEAAHRNRIRPAG